MLTGSTARLLIHAECNLGASRIPFASTLKRLRVLCSDGPRHDEQVRVNVEIDDLQGNRVLAIDAAGPLIRMRLPAGTYQLTAHRGKVRRRYTINLEEGASFDLHLRLAPDRHC